MFRTIRKWLLNPDGPYVHPWGLATPVLVLIVCLPLLKPLRHPMDFTEDERERFALVESIVEHRSMHVGETSFYAPSAIRA